MYFYFKTQNQKLKELCGVEELKNMIKKLIPVKFYELAEVVKDLNKNTDIIADQSYSERQLI